jgi:hypothetical protein
MRPADGQKEPVDLRTDVAHSARIYDYILGGKTNYAADREAAEHLLAMEPGPKDAMRENRLFMHRAVRFLAQQGVRQFLDIGTGIPTSPNLHEVAQSVAPESRVVYVDNDPIVLVHARALLASSPQGRTAYIDACLEHPEDILSSPELRATLDLGEPVALTLIAVLHFVAEESDPHGIVRRLVDALPSGSWLALSHLGTDIARQDALAHGMKVYEERSSTRLRGVDRAGMERFFTGLEIVDPGIQVVHRWRPDRPCDIDDFRISIYGAVARKP